MSEFLRFRRIVVYVSLLALFVTTSCSSRKKVVYFQNAKDFETVVNTDTFTPRLKVNDIVTIYVSTFDLEAAKPFNLVKSQTTSALELVDYIIDIEGNIDYPVLGKVKLLGLTVEEAKELFKKKLEDYLKDPIVNIRILNFRISVLGSVNKPGIYEVSGERITLLEAVALAGDLNIKAKRDNVMVIRDFNGTKTYTRVNLLNKELFNSPVYYLTQNDIVYVEYNRSGSSASVLDGRISVILGVASIIIPSSIILLTRN
ncbi:polysaccharide export protein [Hyunsoonleella sp. SJ7]|uniref:Polysaccharide export protein n=1 Tax=Hyunsoonleella aquatilis TaxID=2762758 RepID=A0A923H9K2_9FLAO|nr:polysaccharide biosynthesis/export family protein [Hyunsoonleella aquatilis]MBC3758973.1 polysaccharide export protein [Hyunsoonleella aquatilis]